MSPHFTSEGRSFKKIFKIRDPRIEPWGMPEVMALPFEKVEFTWTFCTRCVDTTETNVLQLVNN